MIRNIKVFVLAAVMVVVMPFLAMAATAQVEVTADVINACSFSTPSGTLNFGNLDPTSGLDVSASTTLTFTCTNGAGYLIFEDHGQHWDNWSKTVCGGNPQTCIEYGTTYSPNGGYSTGPQNPITLTINGSISYYDYEFATAGHYTDTITYTVTP